jgi:nucleotide-binding universal stress UspA family protein
VSSLYDAVVVGTDGSPRSCRAVQRAGLYGEALNTELVVAYAFHRPVEGEIGPASERAESPQTNIVASGYRGAVDAAEDAAGFARQAAPGVKVDVVAVEGDPATALIDLAGTRGNALLVVGNQGMTGSKRFLLGSVPNKISHHAESDVLITRTGEEVPTKLPERIVIGTDGSDTATRALDRGLALAAALSAEVSVLSAGLGAKGHAVLEDACERADAAGVECSALLRSGEAADELVAAGEQHDLVIVGNRGMTGAARFLLGSVPNKISHHVGADLLIIRTT